MSTTVIVKTYSHPVTVRLEAFYADKKMRRASIEEHILEPGVSREFTVTEYQSIEVWEEKETPAPAQPETAPINATRIDNSPGGELQKK